MMFGDSSTLGTPGSTPSKIPPATSTMGYGIGVIRDNTTRAASEEGRMSSAMAGYCTSVPGLTHAALYAAALLPAPALGEFFHDLVAERRQVIRIAAGDQPMIGHHFPVHPVTACVADIGFQAGEGSQRSTLND